MLANRLADVEKGGHRLPIDLLDEVTRLEFSVSRTSRTDGVDHRHLSDRLACSAQCSHGSVTLGGVHHVRFLSIDLLRRAAWRIDGFPLQDVMVPTNAVHQGLCEAETRIRAGDRHRCHPHFALAVASRQAVNLDHRLALLVR